MHIVRWTFSALLLIGGGALAYLIYRENQLAGSLTGLLILIIILGSATGRRQTVKPAVDDKTHTAVAMRQARAMVRREEGEISGAPTAPT